MVLRCSRRRKPSVTGEGGRRGTLGVNQGRFRSITLFPNTVCYTHRLPLLSHVAVIEHQPLPRVAGARHLLPLLPCGAVMRHQPHCYPIAHSGHQPHCSPLSFVTGIHIQRPQSRGQRAAAAQGQRNHGRRCGLSGHGRQRIAFRTGLRRRRQQRQERRCVCRARRRRRRPKLPHLRPWRWRRRRRQIE